MVAGAPVNIPDSEFIIECDYVFAAIGQTPTTLSLDGSDALDLTQEKRLKFTRWGSLLVNEQTFETDVEGVFSGGDYVSGAATVIEAIAAGRKAAYAIDAYLETGVSEAEPTHFNSRKDDFRDVTIDDLRYREKLELHPIPELDPKSRIKSFDEVEIGYSDHQAAEESKRCLECGCEALFECKLREYATEYGIKVDRYKGGANEYHLDRSHPLIELDPNKCILCARCIRVCSEIAGASVYGFEMRGFSTIVRPELGKPLIETGCISCGLCVATCPTGAITAPSPGTKPGPWRLSGVRSTCSFCSVGCSLVVNSLNGTVMKITADSLPSKTKGNLCAKGRFGFEFIKSELRLVKPEVMDNGNRVPTNWTKAITTVTSEIRRLKSQVKGEEMGVFVSSRLTNEEMYLIQKFARVILKTNNIGSFASSVNTNSKCQIHSTASLSDIESSDVIVITMANLRRDHTVADFMVRKAKNNGAKVIYIGPQDELNRHWDFSIDVESSKATLVLEQIMKASDHEPIDAPPALNNIKEQLNKLDDAEPASRTGISINELQPVIQVLKHAEHGVVLSDRHYPGERIVDDIDRVYIFSEFFGLKLGLFAETNNFQGHCDLIGTNGNWPGYQSKEDSEIKRKFSKGWKVDLQMIPDSVPDLNKALSSGKLKAAFIFGENPMGFVSIEPNLQKKLSTLDYVFVADIAQTETTKIATYTHSMVLFC